MNEKTQLIFIPSPGIGHLASSLEFANILTNRYNNFHITVLCIKLPSIPSSDSYIKSFLASQSQIQLIDLPQVETSSQDLHKSPEFFILNYVESLKPHVKEIIQTILSSSSNKVVGLVLDFFCVSLIDVGNEFGIPSYLYVPSNVGFLSLMFSLQKRRIDEVYDNSNTDDNQLLNIPGLSKETPTNVLPDACFSKDGGYFAYYKLAERFRETKGIIVNTFSDLEQHSIEALHAHDEKIPPIYAVGPLLDLKSQPNQNLDQSQHDLILKWLDEQPNKSVVFLCFGSFGFQFVPSQITEIALGLKNSGVRFLWSNRAEKKVLPDGFLEWMELEGKGMICGWAPQVEILGHKAIGGFVSHCGWNSILESLWFGVPILTWPIYAEQQLNAFTMVKEFGLSVELKMDYRRGSDVIVADEIEKGLKSLMDNDNIVHKKVKEIKELARNAVVDGGSSFISIGKVIDDIIGSK
ncbi:UDP-glycosyltransferase 71D1-like protein [Trifolium pratense]|uniref:Glycosyltransferase n=1 Tax=Trifolium pratense TaxID=57577 RepID=A0A2K3NJF6_TRIPR|nr:UDP-glycosyltransferase 71D1-like protein [Trifolium pratense]